MAKLSMKKMLEAGVHFGHRSRFWHPKMAPYIYGARNSVHIINLEKTLPMLEDALNFVGKTTASGGKILFVGTKRAASPVLSEEAIRCGMPYVNHRWLGGMMTNYKTIKASIKRLKDLEFLEEDNFSQFGKKEALVMTREMQKLERSLGGIKDLDGIPDVIFVIDIGVEKNAIKEAQKLQIPIIGIVDTNHNPDGIDYVIPGNDDSIRAISFYIREVSNAVLEAKAAIGSKNSTNEPTITKKTETKTTPAKTDKTPTDNTSEKPAEKSDNTSPKSDNTTTEPEASPKSDNTTTEAKATSPKSDNTTTEAKATTSEAEAIPKSDNTNPEPEATQKSAEETKQPTKKPDETTDSTENPTTK